MLSKFTAVAAPAPTPPADPTNADSAFASTSLCVDAVTSMLLPVMDVPAAVDEVVVLLVSAYANDKLIGVFLDCP